MSDSNSADVVAGRWSGAGRAFKQSDAVHGIASGHQHVVVAVAIEVAEVELVCIGDDARFSVQLLVELTGAVEVQRSVTLVRPCQFDADGTELRVAVP